jgi:hypothetical protein
MSSVSSLKEQMKLAREEKQRKWLLANPAAADHAVGSKRPRSPSAAEASGSASAASPKRSRVDIPQEKKEDDDQCLINASLAMALWLQEEEDAKAKKENKAREEEDGKVAWTLAEQLQKTDAAARVPQAVPFIPTALPLEPKK